MSDTDAATQREQTVAAIEALRPGTFETPGYRLGYARCREEAARIAREVGK